MFPGVRPFRAPIWCPSGGWRHARGREHCRGEPGSALLGGYAPVRRRRRAARSSMSQGRAKPLCARNLGVNRNVSEGKTDVWPTVIFLPTRATRSGERARFVGLFQGCTGLWTAGFWLARRLHQLKAPTTMDLGTSFFLIFVRCVALRNLDLLIKIGRSVICRLCC